MHANRQKSAHTPGPWIDAGWSSRGTPISGGGFQCAIAHTPMHGFGKRVQTAEEAVAEGKANASLIAAAPDLLAALRECEGFCKGHQETPEKVARYQRVRAAIVKAEAAQQEKARGR